MPELLAAALSPQHRLFLLAWPYLPLLFVLGNSLPFAPWPPRVLEATGDNAVIMIGAITQSLPVK
jgi:hypothetical protein